MRVKVGFSIAFLAIFLASCTVDDVPIAIADLPDCSGSEQKPHGPADLQAVLDLIEAGRVEDGRVLLAMAKGRAHSSAERSLYMTLAMVLERFPSRVDDGSSIASSSPASIVPLTAAIYAGMPAMQVWEIRRAVVLGLLRRGRFAEAVKEANAMQAASVVFSPDAKARRVSRFILAYCLARAGQADLCLTCAQKGLRAAEMAEDESEVRLWKKFMAGLQWPH